MDGSQKAGGDWTAREKIGRGIAVRRYAPRGNVANVDTPLDVGDEVYVFEVHSSGKWLRGYIVTSPRAQAAFNQPLPRSKKINNAALKPLDLGVAIGVFPAAVVKIKEEFETATDPTSRLTGITNSLMSDFDTDSLINSYSGAKPTPPAIPALRMGHESLTLADEPIVDDITAVIKEWHNTYVFHHFLFGNYSLIRTVQAAIKDLYEIRRKLAYQLLTANERIIARKKAIWQIARITKILKRGIVVRDGASGQIMSGEDGPVRLAQEQILLALAPNYPDHAVVGDVVKMATVPKHFLVDFKSCVGQGYGHGLTVLLQLRTKTHRLTESFRIRIRPDTMLEELSAVLFRDLPISITKDDVYLVAKLFEEVSLKSKNATPISQLIGAPPGAPVMGNTAKAPAGSKSHARRGVAAGAADISRLFRVEESQEAPFTIRMYANYFGPEDPSDDNRGWGQLVERIVRGRPRGVATTPRAQKVVCTVKEFEGASVSNIAHLASEDSNRAMGLAKSLFVSSLTEPRDDVYIHLDKISLNYATKPIQDFLVVSLSSSSGNVLFSNASNAHGSKTWDSAAAYNNEIMGEMVGCSRFQRNEIVYLSLYVSGEFLGQGCIPLWHGNRIWSGKRTINFVRDGVNVATLGTMIDFVGNGYNTDVSVEKVLNWKMVYEKNGIEELSATLIKFNVIEDTEFIKRFHDIMDALFDMLSSFLGTEPDEFLLQIFHAIIFTFEKVTGRTKEYTYLGVDYLENRFNFAGMSEILLSMTERCLLNTSSLGYQLLINLFKVSEFISQLVASSAAIDSDRGKESQINVSMSIRRYVRRITEAIKQILSKQDRSLVDLQLIAVQSIFQFYYHLRQYVPSDELAQFIIEATDSIRTDNDKINTQRLLLVRKLSTSWLYKQAKYRPHITAYTIKWTLQFWISSEELTPGRREQIRLVSGIFATQFKILWPVRHEEPDVCKRYGQLLPLGAKLYTELLSQFEAKKRAPCPVFSPLFPENYPFEVRAVDSVVNDSVFDETLIELGIVFTLIVNIAHFNGHEMPDNSLTQAQVTELAANIIRACTAMLNCVSFPKMWVSLLAVHHETVLGCLDYLSILMKTRFIPAPENAEAFNSGLWFNFLRCIVRLAGSEAIAVEHLPEQKRAAIWKIAGDIRARAVVLLRDVWDAIGWPASEEEKARFGLDLFGGFQVQMFGGETSLVRDVLNLCLVRHAATQKTAVYILQTMIVSEWTLNEELVGLQREIIASLDDIFQTRTYLPESQEKRAFNAYLRSTFNIDPEDEATPTITHLLDGIEEFLDLLLDLYNIPPGDAFNDDRIFHALNVLNFLKDIDRVEIFSRYVNDIAQWNRAKLNYTQTGLALKLLASAYSWSFDERLEASEHPSFPAQTSFERKEALYEDIIQSFTRGRAFENAIEATKELIAAYETYLFDFKKLASATRILAKLYDSVDNVDRLSPQYFRVAYIGIGFPRALRNKQFIFEGNPWEKLESIHERLHKIYPGATIVSNEAQAKVDGQYLYVSAVNPEPSADLKERVQTASPGAKEYLARKDLRFFSYSRPLPNNTSPLDLWVEKTMYETYQAFPTIVKRSEVKHVTVVKLSPIENALSLIVQKTSDLLELEMLFKSGRADQSTMSKLDLVLSGSVDSPVNGGIQIYRTFLEDVSLKEDPQMGPIVTKLELAFLEYAVAIQRCLAIHGRVVPATLRPLHDSLNQLFERNFAPELSVLGSNNNDLEGIRQGMLSRLDSNFSLLNLQDGPSRAPSINSSASTHQGSMNSDNQMVASRSAALDSLLLNASISTHPISRQPSANTMATAISTPQMSQSPSQDSLYRTQTFN
ncbi:DOCK-like protein 1 [Trichomonascus vanleenenianus]|uniref:guanine nucleotide exchange factor DCK1 n=1 Tax=Trichomonascus vanleenenianus TaxID=2268995 RepID=UPI003ECAB83B